MKSSVFRSLLSRVTLFMWIQTLVVVLFSVAVSMAFFYHFNEQLAIERIKEQEATLVANGLVEAIADSSFSELNSVLADLLGDVEISDIVRVYDPPDRLLFTNFPQPELDEAIINRAAFVNRGPYIIHGVDRDYLAILKSHRSREGRMVWVELATLKPNMWRIIFSYLGAFVFVLVFSLLCAFVLGLFLSKWSMRAALDLSARVRNYQDQEIPRWKPLSLENLPQEVSPVVNQLNTLIAFTQEAFIRHHRLGEYIAHEVRTPLTALLGELEMSLLNPDDTSPRAKSKIQSAIEEIKKIDRIVTTVTEQSLLMRGRKGVILEPFLLKPWLERELASSSEGGSKIRLIQTMESELVVFTDQALLSLVLSNLIRNAQKHGGSACEIVISLGREDRNILFLAVENRGAFLSDEEIRALQMAKPGDPQLGLGLSLCKQISDIARLQLGFSRSSLGGLKVMIRLQSSHLPE